MNTSSSSCENFDTDGASGEYTDYPELNLQSVLADTEPCECTAPTHSTTNTTAAVTTEHAHSEDTPLSPGVSGEGQQGRTDSCTAIRGGLGALAVVLTLTLVGVVLGWVWHCRRNSNKR